ncbi:TIGR04282 family arsenosugar biosynthesis glycosyltransferase [Stieleria sp. JC731]|nr:TIGR04282 family arsenosugar biosynthesis glycosyltransferase [Stieleria sp. JC731]MCC9599824.1 TIGR04282 family arsenosugar biosynthesis glycosyltransferase [Stieleria sp. JC731]
MESKQIDRPNASGTVFGVMAKYWEPGRVKTRLGKSIGLSNAAEIHRLFCQHIVKSMSAVAYRQVFVVAPAESREAFDDWLKELSGSGSSKAGQQDENLWGVVTQSAGDLGVRMRHWFRQPLADGDVSGPLSTSISVNEDAKRILIGADCPLIDSAVISDAESLLSCHDVVLGPAADGGYYLIGLRGWDPCFDSLFEDISWGTESVFDETIRVAELAGLSVGTTAKLSDVDNESDLINLRRQLLESNRVPWHRLLEQIDGVLAKEAGQ